MRHFVLQRVPLKTRRGRNQRRFNRWKQILEEKDPCGNKCLVKRPLILAENVLLDAAERFQFSHFACETDRHLNAVELATYLGCPLIASNSNYYLFTSDTIPPCTLIPTELIQWDVKQLNIQCERCQTLRKACHVLSCKKFDLSGSPLKCLNPKLKPLLPLLFDNDSASSMHKWEDCVREIDTRVKWLSQFNNNDLVKPMVAVLAQIDQKQLISKESTILKSMFFYIMGSVTMNRKIRFLNLPSQLPCRNRSESHLKEIYKDAFNRALSYLRSDDNANSGISLGIRENPIDSREVESVIGNWPITLTEKFCRSEFTGYALDALYAPDGVLLADAHEDTSLPQSVHKVSGKLREMQYNILFGLEDRLGRVETKCFGVVDHYVTELMLLDGQYQPIRVPCNPHHLDPAEEQSTEQFMSKHFGQTKLTDPFDRQLYWIVSFWFRNSTLAGNQCETVDDSPLALAFTANAYMWKFKQYGNRKIPQLVEQVQTICRNGSLFDEGFRVSVVHQLTELQLVAYEMNVLSHLVSGILLSYANRGQQIVHNEKLWVWRMFGSCQLIYWLTIDLERVSSNKRMEYLKEQLMPELAGPQLSRNKQCTLQQAINEFDMFWDTMKAAF